MFLPRLLEPDAWTVVGGREREQQKMIFHLGIVMYYITFNAFAHLDGAIDWMDHVANANKYGEDPLHGVRRIKWLTAQGLFKPKKQQFQEWLYLLL